MDANTSAVSACMLNATMGQPLLANLTACGPANGTVDCSGPPNRTFETVAAIVVPIIFSLIALAGFVGNLLVIVVVWCNKQMRNTTNLLIINLAVADLVFIIVCVPFTATIFAIPVWPFGNVWCKVYRYVINVTAYASVYTLVFMSLDRYLAVVHPISSITIRTERNAWIAILVTWIVILFANSPLLYFFQQVDYAHYCEERSGCMNTYILEDSRRGAVFYGCFFAFAFAVPLLAVCVLYGLMVKRLLYHVVPGGSQSIESLRSKRRVTRMVIVVVLIFALCWLPLQVIFLLLHVFNSYPATPLAMAIQIASNCLAYVNSCVNPMLYAFLSDNFRKGFRRLLCNYTGFTPVKLEMEPTNARGVDNMTRTTTAANTSNLRNPSI